MATTTSLLGLTKPAVSEAADISVINENFNIIDAFIKGTGLGTTAKSIDSLDNATTFGLYTSNAGLPGITGTVYWVALALPFSAESILQIASQGTYDPLRLALRRMTNGAWGEWEYPNPPMVAGTEYRTTERSNSKPVFKKRIVYTTTDIGTKDTLTSFNVPHGISGFGELVSINAKIGTYPMPYLDTAGNLSVVTGVTSTNITIRLQSAWSGERTWTFDLAYTKA